MNLCQNCNAETKNKMYCSRSCSAKVNNKVPKRKMTASKQATCLWCGLQFFFHPMSEAGKYCTNSCQQQWQKKNIIEPKIERGECHSPDVLRRYLIENRGETCEICRCEATHNNKPLVFEVHHCDGNSDNDLPSNLQLVCPNCHSQIPVVRSKKQSKRSTINSLRTKKTLALLAQLEVAST